MKTTIFTLLLATGVFSLGFGQGVKISTTLGNPHPSAIFEVESATQGSLPARMTTAQRDAISNPASGLQIFNTTIGCPQYYFSGNWYSQCGVCDPPDDPTASAHTNAATQITWNWNSSLGATGYKYNTTNDYGTASDNGNSTSYLQTGLPCGTPYTLYIWAYSGCNVSNAVLLNYNTAPCPIICGSTNVNFTYRGSPVSYGTVSGQNGTCWLDRNLGASQVAVAHNDANAYGDLFQWGRLDDGHQSRTASTTTTLSSTDVPGHGNFIVPSGVPYDWRSPQNANLWQGVSGINNPCPVGWRLPTLTELDAERATWSPQDYTGAYASPLKWSAGGWRSTGTISGVGTYGWYWTSTTTSNTSQSVRFRSTDATVNNLTRRESLSVRCIFEQ